MKLANEMRIGRPPAEVFDALLDVERVAGCMPGSKLTGKTGDDTYAGEVKVKVGPLSAAYSGTVRYMEVNRDERRITLRASGKEKGGQGNADAHVVASVLADDDGDGDGNGAKVSIDTDLMIRGKVAQFGSGVIGEVSERLIGQFAGNVEQLLSGHPEQATVAPHTIDRAAEQPATRDVGVSPEPDSESTLDGVSLVLAPLLKRAAPAAAGTVAGLLIGIGLARVTKPGSRQAPNSPTHRVARTAYLLVPVETNGGS